MLMPSEIKTFPDCKANKAQALKILEEAAEVYSAWEDFKNDDFMYLDHIQDITEELADVIQAACNFLAALGIEDASKAMEQCYLRNKRRGRFKEVEDE